MKRYHADFEHVDDLDPIEDSGAAFERSSNLILPRLIVCAVLALVAAAGLFIGACKLWSLWQAR